MIFVLINCFWTSLRTWMGRVDNFNNQWDFWIQFLTNFQILYLIWTPLSMQPHGRQGSQKQQNSVVNLNLYDWCTDNTQPDLNQTAKTAKSAKKSILFFSVFSTLFNILVEYQHMKITARVQHHSFVTMGISKLWLTSIPLLYTYFLAYSIVNFANCIAVRRISLAGAVEFLWIIVWGMGWSKTWNHCSRATKNC